MAFLAQPGAFNNVSPNPQPAINPAHLLLQHYFAPNPMQQFVQQAHGLVPGGPIIPHGGPQAHPGIGWFGPGGGGIWNPPPRPVDIPPQQIAQAISSAAQNMPAPPAVNGGGPEQPLFNPGPLAPGFHVPDTGVRPADYLHAMGGHDAEAAGIWAHNHPGAMAGKAPVPAWVSRSLTKSFSGAHAEHINDMHAAASRLAREVAGSRAARARSAFKRLRRTPAPPRPVSGGPGVGHGPVDY